MPTLKQLTCAIEWAGSQIALKEYSTAYSDGFVQTYVAIPPVSTTFSVHLRSNGYIAPGLAMFVYMDGKYQCNRNRRNLKVPDGTMSRRHTEIDFRVRQKEEKLEDGSYLGKEWRFEKLSIVTGNAQALQDLTIHNFEHLGTIEVVVLRCRADPVLEEPMAYTATPPAEPKPMPSKLANPQAEETGTSSHLYHDMVGGLFDGAGDERKPLTMSMPFGGDGGWDQPSPRMTSGQPWDYTMTNENQGFYHPANQPPVSAPASQGPHRSRSRGRAHHRFTGDWTAEQDSRGHGQREPSRQRVPSFHSAGGSAGPTAAAWPASPVSSVRNVGDRKGQGAPQVSIPPGGPAVVINVNQPAPAVPGWGGVPDNLARPSSPVDSWVTKKSLQDYEAQRRGSWQGGDHAAREQYAPQPMQYTVPPADQGVEFVDGKWRPKKPTNFGWSIGEDQKNPEFNQQRRTSHANVTTTQQMPGAWGPSDNYPSHPPWKAHSTNDQAQKTNWGGEGNESFKNNNGRYYGSDSSINDNLGGREARNQNQHAPAGWNTGPIPGKRNAGNNAGQQPGNWNQGSNHNGSGNNQQAPTAGRGAYANTPAQNSPLPGTPIHNTTVMPGAWGQPANGFTQEPPPQPPPPPPQPSPPIFTQAQVAVPAPAQQGPPAAHSRVHSIALSTQPQVKPYWAAWNKPPSPPPAKEPNTSRRRSEVSARAYVVEEEPLYSVPEEIAAKKRTSHQVQPGPGAMYAHKVHSPRYMDSMEEPYAVFVFKYRSKEVLEQLLNLTISDDPEDEKKRLMNLSKDEIIEELLAAKVAPTTTIDTAPPPAPAAAPAPAPVPPPAPAIAPAPDQNPSWAAAPASSPLPQNNAVAANQRQNNTAAPTSNQWQNNTNNASQPAAPAKHDPFAAALAQKLGRVAGSDAWGGGQQNATGQEFGGRGNGGNWGAQMGGGLGGSQHGGGGNWSGHGHGRGEGRQPSNGPSWGQGGAQGNVGNLGAGPRGGGGQAGGGNWGAGGAGDGGGGGADAPPGVVW